jgi:ATP-dependent Clp protease ATP-binding subunit ClpA
MNQEGLRRFTELTSERVIGQHFALSRIKDALAGASNSRRPGTPLAALLFVGGTGLGKSTTARAMARVLFGSETAYREIQTSERTEQEIIEALSERPCVAFLKNAEEENEQVRSELASVLRRFKTGRPMDGENGQMLDSIFIASLRTDLPLELILPGSEESRNLLREWLQRRFKGQFADDFFQSFDAIVPFKHFDVATKVHLAELKISEMAKRQVTSGRTLTADNSVAAYVGSRARDELGALEVQRAFDQYVSTVLNEAVGVYEGAGKRATMIRLSVVAAEIRISVE